MQTNKKPNIALEAFDMAKSIQDVSRSGSLYGKLFAIKDMQIHLLQEENKIKEEIERVSEADVQPVGTPQDLQKAAERILLTLSADERNTLQLYYTALSQGTK